MTAYGSDPFAYDFNAALAASPIGDSPKPRRVSRPAGKVHEVAHTEDGFTIPTLPTTAQALLRHAEKFAGSASAVKEVAAVNAIDLKVKADAPKPKRRRRSSQQLVAEVLALHARNVLPMAIGDILNVADRRVKEIIAAAA